MFGLEDYGSDSDTDRPKSKVSGAQPAKKTQRPPKKIAITLPVIKGSSPVDEDIERPVKRQKIGAGASSLLSMLPTPKQATPYLPPQRVLGGGAAEGSTFTQSAAIFLDTAGENEEEPPAAVIQRQTADVQGQSTSTLFRPPSLAKGKKNVSVEEPGINRSASKQKSLPAPTVDFFSLGKANTLCS